MFSNEELEAKIKEFRTLGHHDLLRMVDYFYEKSDWVSYAACMRLHANLELNDD